MRSPSTSPLASNSRTKRCVLIRTLPDFHAQRRQIIDIEEAAVIDFVGSRAPESQTVGLGFQQFVQRIEILLVIRRPVVDALNTDTFSWINRATSALVAKREARRRLCISLSRARSATASGKALSRDGK